MQAVQDWLNEKTPGTRRALLLTVPLATVAVAIGVGLSFKPAATVAGSLAGVVLFGACYGYWHTLLSPERQAVTDLKARLPLVRRRITIAVLALLWFTILLLTHDYIPGIVGGILNIWVVAHLFWLFRATPLEAAEAAERARLAEQAADEEYTEHDSDLDGEDLDDAEGPNDGGATVFYPENFQQPDQNHTPQPPPLSGGF